MVRSFRLALISGFALASAPALADQPGPLSGRYSGPERQEIDILRVFEGGPRIYVQAKLPDGELGLFLVDTGADISVISQKTADRLHLPVEKDQGSLIGISGSTPMDRAVLPSISLGEMLIPEIEVAVGVPGVSEYASYMPLDGLLGNNVWSRFVLEIDYPADLIVLHEPDTVRHTRKHSKGRWGRVAPMHFDRHVYSEIEITTPSQTSHRLIAQIDTGAGDLTLCAGTGSPFEHDFTEGVESVRGIGASETLPPFRFLEMTRRIPLASMDMGGQTFDIETEARWRSYDDDTKLTCRAGFRALLGHNLLSAHRVFFDYGNQTMALRNSSRKKRQINGHDILLAQDRAAYGDDPSRNLYRAKLVIGAGGIEEALGLIEDLQTDDPVDRAEAAVLRAALYRLNGQLDRAWDALKDLSPAELVDQKEIVATVNGLLFTDRSDEALAVATAATDARPDNGWAYVARADVYLHLNRVDEARADLLFAAQLEEFPDAHLLRRARAALATGDRYGSMAHVRKLLQLYPFGGEFLWFYALLIENAGEADTFREDMASAMGRLHPERRPVDFVVAAHHALGDQDLAESLMRDGIAGQCEPLSDAAARDNCLAWFYALAGVHGDEALMRIERALAKTGDRSDYLDTKAMVHLARREFGEAHTAAVSAARLSPDDVYMLWQAERIGEMVDDTVTAPSEDGS